MKKKVKKLDKKRKQRLLESLLPKVVESRNKTFTRYRDY